MTRACGPGSGTPGRAWMRGHAKSCTGSSQGLRTRVAGWVPCDWTHPRERGQMFPCGPARINTTGLDACPTACENLVVESSSIVPKGGTMSATATPKPAPKAEPKPPTFKDLQSLDDGTYRVTFEKRSTWTATLLNTDDGLVLRYEASDE